MIRDDSFLTVDIHEMLEHTVVVKHRLEEQYRDLEHQTETAVLGMWLFLATEVMFFGTLFAGLAVYRYQHPAACEAASARLNWQIGAINTVVLLVSSLTMALAVYYARTSQRRPLMACLLWTAGLGALFLGLKACEYYSDYTENLIPLWKFEPREWTEKEGLSAGQVRQVELFLLFYWIMTPIHALHLVIGISVVLILTLLAARNRFSDGYYAPVELTGLYWHFVDIVWIFLLPMLYLLGTH